MVLGSESLGMGRSLVLTSGDTDEPLLHQRASVGVVGTLPEWGPRFRQSSAAEPAEEGPFQAAIRSRYAILVGFY